MRRIFDWYDAGFGLKAIAKRLAVEQALKPPMNRKDGLDLPRLVAVVGPCGAGARPV